MAKKLYDFEGEYRDDGGIKYTDPDTGAWVKIIHDDDCHYPFDDAVGIAIAFRERDKYSGTDDDIPDDLHIECPWCEGDGTTDDRWVIRRGFYGPVIAAGSYESMSHEHDGMSADTFLERANCPRCKGDGYIEANSIEAFVRVDRGARAAVVFNTGNHGEATAVVYVTDDGWTDPQSAAQAWADEYQKWAEGDCWGIEWGSKISLGDSCWGFIGWEHAKAEAMNFLNSEIEEVKRVRENNIVRSEN